jgi:hypothetical protein
LHEERSAPYKFFVQLLFVIQNVCYIFPADRSTPAREQKTASNVRRRAERGKEFFYLDSP